MGELGLLAADAATGPRGRQAVHGAFAHQGVASARRSENRALSIARAGPVCALEAAEWDRLTKLVDVAAHRRAAPV